MNEQHQINLLQRTLHEPLLCFAAPADMHLTSYLLQFNYLQAATGQVDQARQIWSGLLSRAQQQLQPLVWLERELNYEITAASIGDRRRVALEDLTISGLTDEALDIYNDRITRW